MEFNFTVLGSAAAAPTKERNPSGFIVKYNKNQFLIDCAEGTQIQFLKYGIKHQKIDRIFISHLHGDHFFGLVGLLSTMHLMGRNKELHIYCHKDLEQIVNIQLETSHSHLRFPLHFHFHNFETKNLIYENKELEIYSFPLDHNIPCSGFIFQEKTKPRKLIKGKIPAEISIKQINQLLKGEDVLNNNRSILYKNEEFTETPPKSRKFVYCSDTRVSNMYKNHIKNVDLLYHEATFLNELKARAYETFHSTALDVGLLAKECEVNQLIIGHFSARYKNLTNFIAETSINHQNVLLAEEGKTYNIE